MQYSAAQGYFSPEIARFFSFLRLNRFEHSRSRRRARGAGISSNASPKTKDLRAGRARFCHVGSIVSNAPAAVDALEVRAYRPTHRCSITEQQAARARFCHAGSIVSDAPVVVDALGARAYRPTHAAQSPNCDQPARDIAMLAHLGAASLVRRFAALATPSTAVSAPSAATNALASRRRLSALSGSAVRASITSAESAAWTSFQ